GLADMDWPIVLDQDHGFSHASGFGAIKTVELFQMRDEIGATLGPAGMNDELAFCMIERANHGDFLGLPRRRYAQIGTALGPSSRQIGMGERFAFIAEQQNNVARLGLSFAELEPQADTLDLGGGLPTLQRVPRPSPAEVFFRNAFDNCDRLM